MNTPGSPLALLADPTLLKADALVGGQWIGGDRRFAVTDPATGAHLANVANLGAEQGKPLAEARGEVV